MVRAAAPPPPAPAPSPPVTSGTGPINAPATNVRIDKNSRGYTFGVEYRHDDPDEALRVARRLFDALHTAYGTITDTEGT